MQALMKVDKGKGLMEIREVQMPPLPDDHVMIEVKAAGLCGTDVHILKDEFPYYPPVILGHEFSGEIVELGSKVKGWDVGDRVVAEPHTLACGQCAYCRNGDIHLCPERRSIGWGIDGAFAEYLPMPSHLLHRIPPGVTFDQAALAEPMAVAVGSVLLGSRVEPGDFVVVLGPGPIGLLAALTAKVGGACEVVVVGTGEDAKVRLPAAEKIDADHIIDLSKNPDPVQFVMDLTRGRGADLIIEAAGATAAIDASIRMVRRKGRIAALGLTHKPYLGVPWDEAVFKACEIKFFFSTTFESWERSLILMGSADVDLEPIISDRTPLKNWETAFERLERKEGIKIILHPGKDT